jgi:hypothetical protein
MPSVLEDTGALVHADVGGIELALAPDAVSTLVEDDRSVFLVHQVRG